MNYLINIYSFEKKIFLTSTAFINVFTSSVKAILSAWYSGVNWSTRIFFRRVVVLASNLSILVFHLLVWRNFRVLYFLRPPHTYRCLQIFIWTRVKFVSLYACIKSTQIVCAESQYENYTVGTTLHPPILALYYVKHLVVIKG